MLETFSANLHGSSGIDSMSNGVSATGAQTGVAMGLLHAVLNQVDYGLAVVNADTRQLVYANAPALDNLIPNGPQDTGLCLENGLVCARRPAHAAQLALALTRTKARLRSLLCLADDASTAAGGGSGGSGDGGGIGSGESTVAVMPLFDSPHPVAVPFAMAVAAAEGVAQVPAEPCYALLVFPKRHLCDTTTITLFARERGLTGTEGQVLAMLCKGLRPSEIATSHGVQVCTVRSQLRSIRQKTASDSVRELVEKVSVLPPMARYLQQVPIALQAAVI
jgi:DNA-binding CsgD family transcriptional regulator